MGLTRWLYLYPQVTICEPVFINWSELICLPRIWQRPHPHITSVRQGKMFYSQYFLQHWTFCGVRRGVVIMSKNNENINPFSPARCHLARVIYSSLRCVGRGATTGRDWLTYTLLRIISKPRPSSRIKADGLCPSSSSSAELRSRCFGAGGTSTYRTWKVLSHRSTCIGELRVKVAVSGVRVCWNLFHFDATGSNDPDLLEHFFDKSDEVCRMSQFEKMSVLVVDVDIWSTHWHLGRSGRIWKHRKQFAVTEHRHLHLYHFRFTKLQQTRRQKTFNKTL